MRIFKLGVLCALALPVEAKAMDCVRPVAVQAVPRPPGYNSGFINGSASALAPTRLPANAAGVLFHTDVQPHASEFTIVETATGARLPVRLTAIRALMPRQAMPEMERFVRHDEQLYRVEPQQGFKAGHNYQVLSRHAGSAQTYIHIDHTVIDPRRLAIVMRPAGMANRENLTLASQCMSHTKAVLTQYMEFAVPARLRPYQHLIAAVPVNQGKIAWHGVPQRGSDDVGANQPRRNWHFAGLQGRLYFAQQAHYRGVNGHSKVAAMAGFLEIEDQLYQTAALGMSLDPSTLAAADSLDFLRRVLRSKEEGQLLAVLQQIPVRQTDTSLFKEPLYRPDWENAGQPVLFASLRFDQRQLALQAALVRLQSHPDTSIRIAAAAAMVRVLQHGRHDMRSVNKAARALARAAKTNNLAVRQSAADGLRALLHLIESENRDYFCKRTRWRKWFAPCLDPALFEPRPPRLHTGL